MALLTAATKLAFVHIVSPVACNAGNTHRSDIFSGSGGLFMAAFTGYFAVAAFKFVFGFGVVIERPHSPSPCVVASFTAHTQPLFVLVVLFMAGKTITGGIFVTRCFMAAFARCSNVSSGQRKARQCMVKPGHFPRLVTVACLALVARLAVVLIVFFVATKAVHRRVAITL